MKESDSENILFFEIKKKNFCTLNKVNEIATRVASRSNPKNNWAKKIT